MNKFEAKFKNQLEIIKKSDDLKYFEDAIFSDHQFFLPQSDECQSTISIPKESTEKFQTIEALKKYIKTEKEDKILKETVTVTSSTLKRDCSQDKIIKFAEKASELKLEVVKVSDFKNVDILLVGNPDNESNYDNLTEIDFSEEKWILLCRMIKALNISLDRIAYSLPWNSTGNSLLDSQVLHLKPKVVMTLGAMSTNMVLNKKERLTSIHGQFFPRRWNINSDKSFETQVFPLFHPEFLVINPNMKRTAWIDMQKCLEFLSA